MTGIECRSLWYLGLIWGRIVCHYFIPQRSSSLLLLDLEGRKNTSQVNRKHISLIDEIDHLNVEASRI